MRAAIPTDTRGFTAWFLDFLKNELTPYSGRGTVVARIVIAAAISMILVMTFRIPGGALGPLYAFIVSRENLVSTIRSAVGLSIGLAGTIGSREPGRSHSGICPVRRK